MSGDTMYIGMMLWFIMAEMAHDKDNGRAGLYAAMGVVMAVFSTINFWVS